MNYKKTILLPQTSFPMKADLLEKEYTILEKWKTNQLYDQILKKNKEAPPFICHDGPPYASGDIGYHHMVNKILKDIVVRSRNMMGYRCEFLPGWDCHGLPIELQVEQHLQQIHPEYNKLKLRQACREHAQHAIQVQSKQFERLGLLGQWDKPYSTMTAEYEATITRSLAQLIRSNSLERRKKPVPWCISCETALADFELEYRIKPFRSLLVGLTLISDPVGLSSSLQNRSVEIAIWTMSPWTLPANQAITVHPNKAYLAVQKGKKVYIFAKSRLAYVIKECAWKRKKIDILAEFPGSKLLEHSYHHPFVHRKLPILGSDQVSLDLGTGCIHTAPGHGLKDYYIGLPAGLQIRSFISKNGRYTHFAGPWVGQNVFRAEELIIQRLENYQVLLNRKPPTIQQISPHCWRCETPVLFRATAQWFLSMKTNDLQKKALLTLNDVSWKPSWTIQRIKQLLEKRSDWCLSRQRAWGVPLPIFYCTRCKTPLLLPDHIEHIAGIYESGPGSDHWFQRPVKQLLPQTTPPISCFQCGHTEFKKEEDTVDIWFDSGVSHIAVNEKHYGLKTKADLYLESSHQHKGWFQSSLLTSLQLRQQSPFKKVISHGLVFHSNESSFTKTQASPTESSLLDLENPQKFIETHGSELFRLWTISENYHLDRMFDTTSFHRTIRAYRKIRNVCRFMLGNLEHFSPEQDSLPFDQLEMIDQCAWMNHSSFLQLCSRYYEENEFYQLYRKILDLTHHHLSCFYFQVTKDRLYYESRTSSERRSAQTVLYRILRTMTQVLAPILCFTAEEIWHQLPHATNDEPSVHLTDYSWAPEPTDSTNQYLEIWRKMLKLRRIYFRSLHGYEHKNQARKVKIYAKKEWFDALTRLDLNGIEAILSPMRVEIMPIDSIRPKDAVCSPDRSLAFQFEVNKDPSCLRCRRYFAPDATTHSQLCKRCEFIV